MAVASTASETGKSILPISRYGANRVRILEDPSLKFNNRTSVDLKDRFRTYFPEDYKRLYPNATSTRERASPQTLAPEAASFNKAKRKDRTPFSKAEDTNLLIGFGKYGGKWSSIQKDESLGLGHRRSTDLRDRFRNAFPEKYVGAGFKPPPAKRRRRMDPDNESVPATTATTSLPTTTEQVPTQGIYRFRTDVSHAPIQTTQIQEQTTTVPAAVRRELSTTINSQPTSGDTFNRLNWTNPHNARMQKEMEMAAKLRRALNMSDPSEMMGETEIPLDPGLSDVAYQPQGQSQDSEGSLTGLLDAAVQQSAWKGD